MSDCCESKVELPNLSESAYLGRPVACIEHYADESGVRGGNADRYESRTGVTQDHQAVEQSERDRAHHEQIQRGDGGSVIAQESPPTVGRGSAAPNHISVDLLTSTPSINHSPRSRGAPHRRAPRFIPDQRSDLGINPWTAADVARLPASRKPRRCQLITVSGWTMMIASRSDGYSTYSHTHSKRSMFPGLTRVGDSRRRTASLLARERDFQPQATLAA